MMELLMEEFEKNGLTMQKMMEEMTENDAWKFKQYCVNEDLENMRHMIENENFNINNNFDSDLPTIMLSIEHNDNSHVVEYLLDNGYDVNTQSCYGYTIFLYALIKERINVIKLLIKRNIPLPMNDLDKSFEKVDLSSKVINMISNLDNFVEFKKKFLL